MAKNPRKQLPVKLRSILQKEIGSKCPFCDNEDVGCFEAHNIDEDRSNTIGENLLLMCPTCHTQVTKGFISSATVLKVKANTSLTSSRIEIYKIAINTSACTWEAIPDIENAFELNYSAGDTFPLLQIHFINHFDKVIVLKDVELKVKFLLSGFGDIYSAMEVPKSRTYKMVVRPDKTLHRLQNFPGIHISAKGSCNLEMELIQKYPDGYYNFYERAVLSFTLYFSNGIIIKLPNILFNTDNENGAERMPIQFLTNRICH